MWKPKTEDNLVLTWKNVKPLLQKLLAARFGFRFHRETAQEAGPALVVAKGGFRLPPGDKQVSGLYTLKDEIRGRGVAMQLLAEMLEYSARQPIIDQTASK